MCDHTKTLEAENIQLEATLKRQIMATKALLERKAELELEQRALAQESAIRAGMIQGRMDRARLARERVEAKQAAQHRHAMSVKSAILAKGGGQGAGGRGSVDALQVATVSIAASKLVLLAPAQDAAGLEEALQDEKALTPADVQRPVELATADWSSDDEEYLVG